MKQFFGMSFVGVMIFCGLSSALASGHQTKVLKAKSGNCTVTLTSTSTKSLFPLHVMTWGFMASGKNMENNDVKSMDIKVDGGSVYTPKSVFYDLSNVESIAIKKDKEPFFYTITLKGSDYTAEIKTGGEFVWERKVWRNADPFRNETTKYHYLEHDAK